MGKKLHVNCYLVADSQAEALRQLVRTYNEPATDEEWQSEGFADRKPSVEILHEESGRGRTGFDLWFATPATAFYFGAAWGQRVVELAQQPAEMPATYPQFLYHPGLRTWLRYNSAECFCLVSESQLQVRRERAQELYKPEEVEVVTEAAFLEAYHQTWSALRVHAEQELAVYQRRGAAGHAWFYCNPLYADPARLPLHLRLHASGDEFGRSWQLLYAHDTLRRDPRRVASSEAEFKQQLNLMLAEAEAAATGGQKGGPADG